MADPSTYRPDPGSIPVGPGVYRFRDDAGTVLYVGKAKNLRNRLIPISPIWPAYMSARAGW